jgi:hypothetical protein
MGNSSIKTCAIYNTRSTKTENFFCIEELLKALELVFEQNSLWFFRGRKFRELSWIMDSFHQHQFLDYFNHAMEKNKKFSQFLVPLIYEHTMIKGII